jgi:hypothetical protein
VQYLGHIITPERVTTDPEKLETVQQLRSFPGVCTCYKRFITGFADIVQLLTQLTAEKRTYQWYPEADGAFRSLKEALFVATVLGYPLPGLNFIVDTVASNVP